MKSITFTTILFIIIMIMMIACDGPKTSRREPIGTKVEIRPKVIIGNKLVKLSGSHDLIMAAKGSGMDSIQVIYYEGSWELLQFEAEDMNGDDVIVATIPMSNILLDVDSIQ